MNRFDYIKYDDKAIAEQNALKKQFMDLEVFVETIITDPIAKHLIFVKLEEAYMWCGKGIRNQQIARNGQAESQEERKSDSVDNVVELKIPVEPAEPTPQG